MVMAALRACETINNRLEPLRAKNPSVGAVTPVRPLSVISRVVLHMLL